MKWEKMLGLMVTLYSYAKTAAICATILLGIDLIGVWGAKYINGMCW